MKKLSVLLIIIMILILPGEAFAQTHAAGESMKATSYVDGDIQMVKSGEDRWDIRIEAGQKEFGFDTIQGACSHKGYAYMALYNRDVERIKIAKVRLSTMEVVRVSDPLGTTAHGNTLTYNTRTNKIIVVCGKDARKRIAFFDPKTMKLTGTKTISISRKKLGEKFNGINALSYNASKNIYVLKVRNKSQKIVLLDSNFRVKKVIKPQGVRTDLLSQGLYTEGAYMYDLQSFKGSNYYNLISIRKVTTGKLVKRIKVHSGRKGQLFELENLFHDNGKWYMSFYRANVNENGDTERKNYLYTIKNIP